MDAITALHTRFSSNLLSEPGPNKTQLDNIVKAAMRACDHRMDGEKTRDELLEKIRKKPLRAPTIIAVVAKIQLHEKVPEIEQVLSAGAAAQMMMVAAHAQGLGAIWRSGSMMFSEYMLDGLGLARTDRIVGFLYLGSPKIQGTARNPRPASLGPTKLRD